MDDASKARTRRKIERAKQRYAEDPEFREKAKAESRAYRVKNADAAIPGRECEGTACRCRNTPRWWLDRRVFASSV
jgi:hypothetical protein